MKGDRMIAGSWRIAVILAIGMIALIPLLPVLAAGQFPATHELVRYEVLTQLFADALANGVLYPRWLPTLAGGHGYPTFVFYQPLLFYISSLADALPGVTPARAVWVADYGFLFVGASGAYRLARLRLNRHLSLAAATLFMLTPFVFVNLLVRGDHSELAAMMLSPWPFWAIVLAERDMVEGERFLGAAVLAAVSLAAIIYAHPVFAMLYVPALAVITLARAVSQSRSLRLPWIGVSAGIFILAAALSSPYWMTILQNAQYVHLERAAGAYFDASRHGVPLSALVARDWGFGFSPSITTPEHPGDMPRPLGLPHLVLATIGGIVAVRHRRGWVIIVGCVYFLLVLAMLPMSSGVWRLWPLKMAQFPWRLLSVIAVFQLFLAITALELPGRSMLRQSFAWVIVAGTALWQAPAFSTSPSALPWTAADNLVIEQVDAMRSTPERFALMGEFDPRWIEQFAAPRGGGSIVDGPVEVQEIREGHQIEVELQAPVDARVVLRQHYFPGWSISVNGNSVPDAVLREEVTPEGLIRLAVPAGRSRIVARYAAPQGRLSRTAFGVSAAAASLLLLIGLQRCETKKRHPTLPSDAAP